MGISKRDLEILEQLNKNDRIRLGEETCKNGHRFPKGKYFFALFADVNSRKKVE